MGKLRDSIHHARHIEGQIRHSGQAIGEKSYRYFYLSLHFYILAIGNEEYLSGSRYVSLTKRPDPC